MKCKFLFVLSTLGQSRQLKSVSHYDREITISLSLRAYLLQAAKNDRGQYTNIFQVQKGQ